MPCSCYYRDARDARDKKTELEKEKTKYDNLSKDIKAAKDALSKYADFLVSLGVQCQSICPTGEPYDMGYCSTYATSINNLVDTTLTPMETSVDEAISDIEDEISAQQAIIDNPYYCNTCWQNHLRRLELMEQRM
ncbi:MAG: hypothetical protein IJB21_05185 [Bacilli bacterium]|nr:hypothetical protein [Bacilli bacterium]MBQ4634064.1 hypothetical protein [Bacilli bacterium]